MRVNNIIDIWLYMLWLTLFSPIQNGALSGSPSFKKRWLTYCSVKRNWNVCMFSSTVLKFGWVANWLVPKSRSFILTSPLYYRACTRQSWFHSIYIFFPISSSDLELPVVLQSICQTTQFDILNKYTGFSKYCQEVARHFPISWEAQHIGCNAYILL